MQRIDHFNLKSFDLNLMLAFDALLAERSVTRAAQRLRVRQPAMSHALSQLRMLLGDDLLIRVGSVMEPTARALALVQPVRELLLGAQDVLLSRPTFAPALERRAFRVGLSDQLEALIIPALVARLRREAPGVMVVTRTTSRDTVFAMVDDGTIDMAIGSFPDGPSWMRRSLLYDEHHVCCFSTKQLPFASPITAEDYLSAPHALVSRTSTPYGYLAAAVATAGISLNVVVTTTSFLSLLLLAAESPVITTVPSWLAARFAPRNHLTISPLPIKFASFPAELVWHQRADTDAGSAWFRAMLIQSSATLSDND